jgi:regulation of enolase protein 1 (concanavalin A-like superfamily)/superfamily II DNA or RNA helicase
MKSNPIIFEELNEINNMEILEVYKSRKIPKYKLEQYILEFKPETPSWVYRKNKKFLVDFIQKYFKNTELQTPDFFDKYGKPYNTIQYEKKLGIEPLKKGELTEQEQIRPNYKSYDSGSKPIGNKTNDIIKLNVHQIRFLEGFLVGNLKSAIMFHGVGTGKTLTAVACARLYLQMYPNNKVIIITPNAVLFNFIDSMASFGVDPRDTRYKYFTYEKFTRSKETAKDSLLIVDEAHNYRTYMDIEYKWKKDKDNKLYRTNEFDTGKSNVRGQHLLIRGGMTAHKTLLLTATPFVNKPYDIANLLAIGDGDIPMDELTFGNDLSGDNINNIFKYRISHFEKEMDSIYFPERREILKGFTVPDDTEEIRAKITRTGDTVINAFFNESRMKSIKYENMKYDFILNEIKKDNKKNVIYVSLFDNGVIPLKNKLDKNNIKYGTITGRDSINDKIESINDYNNFENNNYLGRKIRVLIITRAGAEGVNLLKTKNIFIVDGQWNNALYEQIVARAIRFKSHYDLPKNEQFVNVYKMFICFQREKVILDKINNGGKYDFERFIIEFNKTKEAEKAIESDFKDKFEGGTFDINVLKGLRGKERKEYMKKELKFGKKRHKHVLDELLQNNYPSTDFYLFATENVKQLIINDLIRKIDNIPQVEDYIYKKSNKKELKDDTLKYYWGDSKSNMTKYLVDVYNKKFAESNKIEKDNTKPKKLYLTELTDNKEKFKILKKLRQVARVKQEFFTPLKIAKDLIEFSGIKEVRDKTKIYNVLEPTAGFGNIVIKLLDIMNINKILVNIDMIELLEENRKELRKVVQTAPNITNLLEQKDFLTYNTNKRYNYIFMNPPFLLKSNKENKLIKNTHDIDFVMRAYSLLDINGRLIAITSQNWIKNKEFTNWLNKNEAVIENKTVEWKGEQKLGEATEFNIPISFIMLYKNPTDVNIEKSINEDINMLNKKFYVNQPNIKIQDVPIKENIM